MKQRTIYNPLNGTGLVPVWDFSDDIQQNDPLIVEVVAGENLGGQRMVKLDENGEAFYASNLNAQDAQNLFGITRGASLKGEKLFVRTFGSEVCLDWDWNIDKALFLSVNGFIVQQCPNSGFRLCIGYAIKPTEIFIRIGELIVSGAIGLMCIGFYIKHGGK